MEPVPLIARLRGRGLLLLPVGALVVHQLRYMLAYGSSASSELKDQGHSYLHSLTPWLVASIGLAAGLFLCELARRPVLRGRWAQNRRAISARSLWLCTAGLLVFIYAAQEFLEGLLEEGHPAGFLGIFGHGGWWAIPAAAVVAAAVVALQRVARALIAATRPPVRFGPKRRPGFVRELVGATPRRLSPLAGAAAGRAPPVLRPVLR